MRRTWTIDDFEIAKKIGGGQYAKVYLSKERNTNKTVALKVFSNETFGKKITEEQFLKEIKIQHRLRHDNILKLFGFFCDIKARYIVLEFCECGEMYKDIIACNGYTNERAATYIYQMAHALDYCSDIGVLHRDIKSENILISASGAAKLADFGWSTLFKNNNRHTYCGTLEYMSPEILRGNQQNEKVDIWCLGVLLFEMLTTKTPFASLDLVQLDRKVKYVQFTVPNNVHLYAKYLIINILRENIYERLTAKQIIAYPFVDVFAEKTLTECKAAFVQWSDLKSTSETKENKSDFWSSDVNCPVVDFNKEIGNDIDITCLGEEVDNESFSLLKEIAKKKATNKP